MRVLGAVALAGFIGTILLANWLVTHVGLIDIGFGLVAPAGVLVVGVAFTLRDIVHRAFGSAVVIAAIVVGAVLSVVISPAFALASGAAFLFSELADLSVSPDCSPVRWSARRT
jgi:uncharacterized PurR-regulated membrane protein YhhQ (DUF165 family)